MNGRQHTSSMRLYGTEIKNCATDDGDAIGSGQAKKSMGRQLFNAIVRYDPTSVQQKMNPRSESISTVTRAISAVTMTER